jgi:hypothetical protein
LEPFNQNCGQKKSYSSSNKTVAAKNRRRRKNDLKGPVTADSAARRAAPFPLKRDGVEPPHSTTRSGAENGCDYFWICFSAKQ